MHGCKLGIESYYCGDDSDEIRIKRTRDLDRICM